MGLTNNYRLFGRYAFRKHSPMQEGRRAIINASLWDVMCTGLARYTEDDVADNEAGLLTGYYRLLDDPEFDQAITLGTNQTSRVRRRFEMTAEMLQEVFGD